MELLANMGQLNLVSVRLEMVLLSDEAQVEAHFGPLEDRANLDARWLHGLCRMYHRLRNHFGRTQWNS
jgi:hypothetical protein